MGCICSKGIEGDSSGVGRRRNPLKRLANSSGLEDTLVKDVGARLSVDSNDGGRERLISEPEENGVNPAQLLPDNGTLTAATYFTQTKKAARQEKWGSRSGRAAQAELDAVGSQAGDKQLQRSHNLVTSSMTNGVIAEYVAAGWPAWLTRVAGEAVKGWLPRKLDSFSSMEKIGQGTYSTVYKALDLVTGKTVALKKVRFVNMDAESVRFMAREIYILRRLDHPNVIKLEGLVASKMSSSLWLIFQYMEHDLAGLAARPGINFTQSQIKCFMQQLFNGLNHCHNNGILHRDIKGANLLINDDGILKIADFGLATSFSHEMKHPLTSRVVTLWYRPPELLLGAQEYGVSVDLWSSGCILAELFTRKPILPGRTEVEQLHMIFKLCGSPSEEYWRKSKLPHATIFKPQHPYKSTVSDEFREFPSPAVALLEKLLAVDPADRGTSSSALMSDFFTMEPVACDPSELPKCPPSKELGFKRNVDAVRQREAPKKGNGHESGRKGSKDYKGLPVLASNAEQQLLPAYPRSSSATHNPLGDTGMGLLNERLRGTTENGFAHAGGYGPANKNSKVGHSSSGFGRLDSHISWRRRSRCLSIGNDAKYSGFSGPMASTGFADHIEERDQTNLPKQQRGSAHNQHEANTSATHQFKHPSYKGDDRGKESTAAYVPKRNRIIYSGPIMPTMENIDEMLKEHERKIEQAVREACVKKTKNKMYVKGQSEALLFTGRI